MATLDDVRRLALHLPEVSEADGGDGHPAWRVRGKLFVWERPLRRADLEALGDDAPTGTVLAARTADLGEKDAYLAADPAVFFTTPHFDGHPSVLIRLEAIDPGTLVEVVSEAWLARAPARVARAYLAAQATDPGVVPS